MSRSCYLAPVRHEPENRPTPPRVPHLVELLKIRKERADVAERKRREEDPKAEWCPWVFADKQGRRFSNVRYSLDTVAEASNVTFCLHDLRRTFATVAESLEFSSCALKRLLNHATTSDVTAGYILADTDRLRAPMQRIEDTRLRLGGVTGGELIELRTEPAVA